MMHTAHGGQLARSVGSPLTFVALTATADKANSKKAETERIVLVSCDFDQRKERYLIKKNWLLYKCNDKDSFNECYL